MAIIDKTLKSVENYIKNNEKTDDFYKEKALEILRKFGRLEIAGNVSMQAVVGFGEEGAPVFWDMEAGNLSASAPTGIAVNHFGCATVLLSLVLRFPENAFGYYLFTDEYAPAYFGRDAHCAGSASLCFEKPETHLNLLEKLFSELKYRQTLTGEERGKLPFLLVVFGNYGARCPETEKERFCDLSSCFSGKGKISALPVCLRPPVRRRNFCTIGIKILLYAVSLQTERGRGTSRSFFGKKTAPVHRS